MGCPRCSEAQHESCVMAPKDWTCVLCGHYHPDEPADINERYLCAAVRAGRTDEVARALRESGLTPGMDRVRGEHPLLLAVGAGDAAMARVLLEAGADANAADAATGTAALHLAAGSPALVALLLAHGADVTARNRAGMTPDDVMLAAGQPECARLVAESLVGRWVGFRRRGRAATARVDAYREADRRHWLAEPGQPRRWVRLAPAPVRAALQRARTVVYRLVEPPEAAAEGAETDDESVSGRLRARSIEAIGSVRGAAALGLARAKRAMEGPGQRAARSAREAAEARQRRENEITAQRVAEVDWDAHSTSSTSSAAKPRSRKPRTPHETAATTATTASPMLALAPAAAAVAVGTPSMLDMADGGSGLGGAAAAAAAALFGASLTGIGVPAVVELLFVARLLSTLAETHGRAMTQAGHIVGRIGRLRAPLETVARQLEEHSHVAEENSDSLRALVDELRGVHAVAAQLVRRPRWQTALMAGHYRREFADRMARVDQLLADLQLRMQAEILGEVTALRRENEALRSSSGGGAGLRRFRAAATAVKAANRLSNIDQREREYRRQLSGEGKRLLREELRARSL